MPNDSVIEIPSSQTSQAPTHKPRSALANYEYLRKLDQELYHGSKVKFKAEIDRLDPGDILKDHITDDEIKTRLSEMLTRLNNIGKDILANIHNRYVSANECDDEKQPELPTKQDVYNLIYKLKRKILYVAMRQQEARHTLSELDSISSYHRQICARHSLKLLPLAMLVGIGILFVYAFSYDTNTESDNPGLSKAAEIGSYLTISGLLSSAFACCCGLFKTAQLNQDLATVERTQSRLERATEYLSRIDSTLFRQCHDNRDRLDITSHLFARRDTADPPNMLNEVSKYLSPPVRRPR